MNQNNEPSEDGEHDTSDTRPSTEQPHSSDDPVAEEPGLESDDEPAQQVSGLHDVSLAIARNNFLHKSLSCWNANLFMGCCHGCRVCFVSGTSTNKQEKLLAAYGVKNPVLEWGNYVLVRPWDDRKFLASLKRAEAVPFQDLNADGNRAVMFCSTTDPYQTIKNPISEKQNLLNRLARKNLQRALRCILENSTLNVRILTRSPLARQDFALFKEFGDRLMLGISLPTLDNTLSRFFEPNAPAPTKRLEMLIDAHKHGIPTYVAVAPVYPGTSYDDLKKLLREIKKAAPRTVFMEPVNIRRGVLERLEARAKKQGVQVDFSPFKSTTKWIPYALKSLMEAERAALEVGLDHCLHLWPDGKSLGSTPARKWASSSNGPFPGHPEVYDAWLNRWWNRISEWPGKE